MEFHEFKHMCGIAIQGLVSQIEDKDDDLTPVLFMDTAEGIMLAPVPGDVMNTDMGKNWLMYELVPDLIAQYHATNVAIASSAWMAQYEKGELDEHSEGWPRTRPADMPNKKEVVLLVVVGCADKCMTTAEMTRDTTVTIGEWQECPDAGGRMVDPLVKALQSVTGTIQ